MNSIRYATWPLIATLILTLSACGSETPEPTAKAETAGHAEEGAEAAHAEEGEDAGHAEEEAAEPIKMDAAAMTAAGIRIAKLDKSALNEELRAPGEVLDNAYGTTLITPRVDALVVRRQRPVPGLHQIGRAHV